MATASIFNFIKISEEIATAGQPTKEQLESAGSEGYQAVVNLAPSNPENNALPGEEETVRSLGMSYHHIPVQWTSPRKEEFLAFTEVMEKLKGSKVLIHCAANFRVTAFYSLYAVKHENWTHAQAEQLISKIWASRPDYRMDDVWKSFLDEMSRLSSGEA